MTRPQADEKLAGHPGRAAALPPERKRPERRPAPALGPFHALIDEWLLADREAPRKQRHTARRIFERLVEEHGARISERQVRRYVRERRRELGDPGRSFVPQVHHAGMEAEVNWGEADVVIAGTLTRLHLFHLRLCHSGAAFVQAFFHQSQQAFLEGDAEAFSFLGGVPALVRYDNLSAAVKAVLRGPRRDESDRFVALAPTTCLSRHLAGLEGAHEKGGVESEVGRFRRRNLVPVPEMPGLAELNARLRSGCERDLARRIAGRAQTVGEHLGRERLLLRPLPSEPFPSAEESLVRVDQKGLVCVRQNRYSVPIGLAGRRVRASVGARGIEVFHDGACVAVRAGSRSSTTEPASPATSACAGASRSPPTLSTTSSSYAASPVPSPARSPCTRGARRHHTLQLSRPSASCSSLASAASVVKRTRRPSWQAATAKAMARCDLPVPLSPTSTTCSRSSIQVPSASVARVVRGTEGLSSKRKSSSRLTCGKRASISRRALPRSARSRVSASSRAAR